MTEKLIRIILQLENLSINPSWVKISWRRLKFFDVTKKVDELKRYVVTRIISSISCALWLVTKKTIRTIKLVYHFASNLCTHFTKLGCSGYIHNIHILFDWISFNTLFMLLYIVFFFSQNNLSFVQLANQDKLSPINWSSIDTRNQSILNSSASACFQYQSNYHIITWCKTSQSHSVLHLSY